MKKMKRDNRGFSLIELIIALAVLAFLMLAVSSFMGSSVMNSKKTRVDVKMQTQAQETYSLITDSIMQASEIVIEGYTASDDKEIKFGDVGEPTSATLTKHYYVKDQATADDLVKTPSAFGISGTVAKSDIVLYKNVNPDTMIYVTYMRIESSVPLDMNQVPGGNPSSSSTQTITNSLTGAATVVDCAEQNGKKVYSINDTLVTQFLFDGNKMYYGRKYAYMTKLDDKYNESDPDSMRAHLYNKYFSYNEGKAGAVSVGVPGCVATINGQDGTIGIDLYYNQASMSYTTVGRINPRNSYVLIPRR